VNISGNDFWTVRLPLDVTVPDVVRDDKLADEPDVMTFFQDGMFTPIAVGYSSSPLPIVAGR